MQKLMLFLFPVCFQVRKAASSSSLSAFCEFGADRAAVLPQDHRKHAHGETAVWHVQKLKPSRRKPCSRQWPLGLEDNGWHIFALYFCAHIRDSACCYFFKGHFIICLLFPHQVVLKMKMQFSSYHHACCLFVSYLGSDHISSSSISLFLCFLWQCRSLFVWS